MARSIPASVSALLNSGSKIEPITVVEIGWFGTTFTRYATKTIGNIPGRIKSISDIDEVINIDRSGNSASVDLTLIDEEGTIKEILDTYDIYHRPCRVYQIFDGLPFEDAFLIFSGKIITPIVWDHANLTIDFSILSEIDSREAGFSPEEGQFKDVPDELTGKTWPLCFGSPIHVPATRSGETRTGTSLTFAVYPDTTLVARMTMMSHVLEKIRAAYLYYYNIIAFLESVFRDAKTIQSEFVTTIKDEDSFKQELEDLNDQYDRCNKELDRLIQIYHNLAEHDETKKDALQAIKDQKFVRSQLYKTLTEIANDLRGSEYTKETLKVDAENSKYVYDTIGEIRELMSRLLEEYLSASQIYAELNNVYAAQQGQAASRIIVSGGENFPQNQQVRIRINDQIFLGYFEGQVFNIIAADNNYSAIGISTASTTELGSFNVLDDSINLNGLYCYTTNNKIIKVGSQNGQLCNFNLSNKNNVNYHKEHELEVTGVNADVIKQAFRDSLTGDETYAQLAFLASMVPKDIAPGIWADLAGSDNVQTIKLVGDCSGGTYKLSYDGAESEAIEFDADSDTIRTRLIEIPSLSGLLLNGGADKLTVEGELDSEDGITVTFALDKWIDEGDPFPRIMYPIFANSSGLTKEEDEEATVENPNPTRKLPPYIICHRAREGAREHTINQINSMIESSVKENVNGDLLFEVKKKIQSAWTEFQGTTDPLFKDDLREAFFKNIRAFNEIAKTIDIPESLAQEAYRLINNEEYRTLLDLEILHYLAWVRSQRPITSDVENEEDNYYFTKNDIQGILAASKTIPPSWVANYTTGTPNEIIEKCIQLPQTEALVINVGDTVTLEADYQERYIANILPSTIHSVYAKKLVGGIERLVPLPTSYYIKSENYDYGPIQATVIALKKPLGVYQSQTWLDDGLWVTLTSSVGPNVCDVIEHIITTYTDLTIDATSFEAVAEKLIKYPAHFALLDKRDALDLCKDIAWQSRCALNVQSGVLYIRYLSETPASVYAVTESEVLDETLKISTTDDNGLVTKFTALWKPNYYLEEDIKSVYRHNIAKYGEHPEEFEFFIYNQRALVEKSATFWLIRKANIWRQVEMELPLKTLTLETFDGIIIDFNESWVSSDPVIGEVEQADFDIASSRLKVKCWLPVRLGTKTPYDFAWPANIPEELIFPEVEAVTGGNAGSVANANVPTGQPFDPSELGALDFRPKDYGGIKLGDLSDILPDNPALQYTELDLDTLGEIKTPETWAPVKNKQDKKQQFNNKGGVRSMREYAEKIGSYIGYGRIEKYHESEDIVSESEIINNHDAATIQKYKISLNDGRVVTARVLCMHPSERLPEGMIILVLYDHHLNEYVIQPPVWVEPENAEDL